MTRHDTAPLRFHQWDEDALRTAMSRVPPARRAETDTAETRASRAPMGSLTLAILSELHDNGALTASDISAEIGSCTNTIRCTLSRLAKSGLVKRRGPRGHQFEQGQWVLTRKGTDYVTNARRAAPGNKHGHRPDSIAARAITYILEHGPATSSEIAAALDLNPFSVTTQFGKMRRDGSLRKAGTKTGPRGAVIKWGLPK